MGSWTGKVEWVKKNLKEFYNEKRFLLGFSKKWNAHPNSLLIDDFYMNITEWVDEGGYGFLFPRPWNQLAEHEPKALELLDEHLDYAMLLTEVKS
jgi:hypothetical protein